MATVNPWRRFQQLTNYQSRVVATVYDIGANGTSVVTLRDGTRTPVRGDSVAICTKQFIAPGNA